MATVTVNDSNLYDIADSIRAKLGVQNTYKPSQMANAIDSISGGGSTLGTKTITANGTYDAEDDELDGYSEVTVNVGGITPTGEIEITANGTYDVTNYASADVAVPTGSTPVINPLSVTENGTYTAPSGVDGYSPITVNVPQGSAGYDDFSGGNIQAIISHGQEYILTDYSGSMQGIFAIKFSDSSKTNYEGYWSMAYNNYVAGIQRNSNKDYLNLKYGGSSFVNGIFYPGYAEGEPVTVILPTINSTDTANHPLVIFGSYYNGNLENTKGAFTFYGLNVFDSNGDLVKKFVPWLSNGVACVKELVSGTIYTNSGTGAFDYIDSEGITHTA